jgi:hypothetical protein
MASSRELGLETKMERARSVIPRTASRAIAHVYKSLENLLLFSTGRALIFGIE